MNEQMKRDIDESRLTFIGRGSGMNHAEEAKSLGLKPGDIVRGEEESCSSCMCWWHEVRLTVIWIGETQAVYRKQWRSQRHPGEWIDHGEVANFSLSCREYYLEGA